MIKTFEQLMPELLRISSKEVAEYLENRLRYYIGQYSGSGSAVLGLSGGVDSSVVACLVIRAIGRRKAHFYYLPSSSTSREDEEDVSALVKFLRIPKTNFDTIKIDSIVEAICEKAPAARAERLILGNIKARVRMVLLHSFAQEHGGLVVGTGDKSELTIGYFTKFGDGGVDVLPIGDLYKSQVRQLAEHLGIPDRIYRKPPSPGLWKDQYAEDELGIDYFLLDQILFHRFDLWKDDKAISAALNISLKQVSRIIDLVKKTQHKRYPPEIFKVGFRAHGSDWRYPREWH